MKMLTLSFISGILLVLISFSARAESNTNNNVISFTNKVCGSIDRSGSITRTEVKRKIKANIGWLYRILDLNVGVSGVKSRNNVAWKGISYKDLPKIMPDIEKCRSSVSTFLEAEKNRYTLRYKTCRLKAFGIYKWNRVEIKTKTTDWLGSGHNQLDECEDLIAVFLRDQHISGEYQSVIVTKGERRKQEFFRRFYYQYWCQFKIQWDPLYNVRTDPACGQY